MNKNFYEDKMREISNSMSESWDNNKDSFMKDLEWSFEINDEQKKVIEFNVSLFENWFNDKYDDLVFESIEFEPFFNGIERVYVATIKFSVYEG